jgi:hypothetical protein
VKSDADAFRKRATQCRDVANGTKDLEAQRQLRDLATDLDSEARKIEGEEAAAIGLPPRHAPLGMIGIIIT